jgi:acyl carrier protein
MTLITRDKLVDFIQTQVGIDSSSLTDETPLFTSGLIDSFSLVSMMSFLETEGKFRINPADVSIDNMDSIGRILSYTARVSTEAARPR